LLTHHTITYIRADAKRDATVRNAPI